MKQRNGASSFFAKWPFVIVLGGALLLQAALCGRPAFAASSGDPKEAAGSVNAFAFDLYRQLGRSDGGNIFFSPQNISAAFAMLYEGARDETKEEMGRVFRYGERTLSDMRSLQTILNETSPDVAVVEAANAVWPDKSLTLRDSYADALWLFFNAQITPLDYGERADEAAEDINRWVAEKTHGKIQRLVDGLDSNTKMMLTSAIYFKSEWMFAFPEENTREEPFFKPEPDLLHLSETKVNLMRRQGRILYHETDLFQAVRLPYKENACSMLVLLPRERGNVRAVEGLLSPEFFGETTASLRASEVELFLPKFKLETQYELVAPLRSAGLVRAFTDAAQFSGIAEEPLAIDRVVHKTFIEVDEKATEAAAVTGIGLRVTSLPVAPLQPKIFRADHPFLYFILENQSDALLFMGRYMGP